MATTPEISVVMAVRNAAGTVAAALQAIHECDVARARFEIIVVDDASDDASASVASRYADTVVRLGDKKSGPAYARNRGAELARGDFIAFVDADVLVRPDTLSRMAAALRAEPLLDVVSGRYADASPTRGIVSQYWNLLLKYGDEQRGRATQVFGACSMVRRSVFVSVGMFDEWRFRSPCLEDVELGQRLVDHGSRIGTLPKLDVTHLRRTTMGRLVHDVWERSELLARSLGYRRTRAYAPCDLVFALSGATIPAAAMLAAISLSAAAVPDIHWAQKLVIALAIGAVANLPTGVFFARKRGILFALTVLPLHIMAQTVAVAALTMGWLLRDTIGDRIQDATLQAYSEVGAEMWPPVPRRS